MYYKTSLFFVCLALVITHSLHTATAARTKPTTACEILDDCLYFVTPTGRYEIPLPNLKSSPTKDHAKGARPGLSDSSHTHSSSFMVPRTLPGPVAYFKQSDVLQTLYTTIQNRHIYGAATAAASALVTAFVWKKVKKLLLPTILVGAVATGAWIVLLRTAERDLRIKKNTHKNTTIGGIENGYEVNDSVAFNPLFPFLQWFQGALRFYNTSDFMQNLPNLCINLQSIITTLHTLENNKQLAGTILNLFQEPVTNQEQIIKKQDNIELELKQLRDKLPLQSVEQKERTAQEIDVLSRINNLLHNLMLIPLAKNYYTH